MWFSITPWTWFRGRLLTQDGSWACHTRLCPRTRMPWDWAKETIWSPDPKLNEPLDGSVASHFISLPGVTMSNWAAARLASALMPRSPRVSAVPKYRPLASAEAFRVDAACAGIARRTATAVAAATTAARPMARPRDRSFGWLGGFISALQW